MKILLKILIAILVSMAVLLSAAAMTLVLVTGPALKWAAPVLAKKADLPLTIGRASGNLITGIRFKDLDLDLPRARIRVPWGKATFKFSGLWRKEAALSSLVLRSPVVTIKSGGPEKAGDQAADGGGPEKAGEKLPAWTFAVYSLRVEDGTVIWSGEKKPMEARGIYAELRYAGGRADLESVRLEFMDNRITAEGFISPSPLAADVKLASQGTVDGRARVRGSSQTWTVEARGEWNNGSLALQADLAAREQWGASLEFQNMDTAPFFKAPPWLKPLSGRVSLEGRGLVPAGMAGRASWEIRSEDAAVLSGRARIQDGAAAADLRFHGLGLDLDARGSYRIKDGYVQARGRALADQKGLQELTEDVTLSADAGWKVSGVWPRLRWSAEGTVAGVRFKEDGAESGGFRASGTGPEPLFVEGYVYAAKIRAGRRTMERARIEGSGNLESHKLSISLGSQKISLAARGRGARRNGLWAMSWSSFEINDGSLWRSTAPFTTAAGPGRFALRGFAATNGRAKAAADIDLRKERWEILRLRVEDLDARAWADAGLWLFPGDGVLSLRADLRGPLKKPEGQLRADLRRVRWKGTELGRLDAAARLSSQVLRLEPARWESPGGTLTIRGTIPLVLEKNRPPPFDLFMDSGGMDLAFLGPLVPQADLSTVRLESHLRLVHEKGDFKAEGAASLTASVMSLLAGQVPLHDIHLRLEGAGPSLNLAQGSAKSGNGRISANGSMRLSGPDLRLRVENFPLKLDRWHFTGRAEAEAALQGAWRAPEVTGRVKVLEGDYKPPEKKGKEKKKGSPEQPPAAAPPPKPPTGDPGALAVDVTLSFDHNVWFKQSDSAVEARAEVQMLKEPHEPLRMLGGIESLRGHYVFYGRTFEIQRARVTFAGEVPPDPGLDVEALYTAEESGTRVFLVVTGTVREPRLELKSEPELPEQDILSVLLFGAPLDQVGDKDAGGAAAASVVSDLLVKQLRGTAAFQKLDIDVFRVTRTTENESAVTVGRYLTKDLYVAYDQSLGESGRRGVQAEYSLTPRWSLQGRNVNDRYVVDVLFKYDLP